jgi:hypothetical protein
MGGGDEATGVDERRDAQLDPTSSFSTCAPGAPPAATPPATT